MSIHIRYLGGGQCHPVDEQATLIQSWLPADWKLENVAGRRAFENLDGVDLFVVAGLHFTGMGDPGWPTPMAYEPMTGSDLAAFRDYVASGRPVMGFHGGVASYDDCPEFGQLVGVYWNWATTAHTPVGIWPMKAASEDSPIAGTIKEFTSDDEIYYNLQLAPYLKDTQVHLKGFYHEMFTPLILTATGGRVDGAGKVAYFGLGHSMASMEAPEVRELLLSTLRWTLHS